MSDFRFFQDALKRGDLKAIASRMQERSRERVMRRYGQVAAMRKPLCPICGHDHGPPFDFCRAPKGWREGDPIPEGSFEMCGCPG